MSVVYDIKAIERITGVADTFGYVVDVVGYNRLIDHEFRDKVVFVGSLHSDSVRLVWESGNTSTVDTPERFGPALTPEWVRRFYS